MTEIAIDLVLRLMELMLFLFGPCSVTASTSHLQCDGGVRIPHVSTKQLSGSNEEGETSLKTSPLWAV